MAIAFGWRHSTLNIRANSGYIAGIAIMFYGYDQGVMAQVNLNPDYQTRMGINPVTGIHEGPRSIMPPADHSV